MIDDDRIRGAFTALAESAPDPVRVHASMVVRGRRLRQRRAVLRWAGTGAAAVAVGAVGVAGRSLLAQPAAPAEGGGWFELPLRYRPAWLPGEFDERYRSVVLRDGTVLTDSRGWLSESMTGVRQPTVELLVGRFDADLMPRVGVPLTSGGPVDVNGAVGRLDDGGEEAGVLVAWQPAGGPPLHVLVYGTGEPRADALRVARSVRPDPRSRLWIGPRFGWLPARWPGGELLFTVRGHHDRHGAGGAAWSQSLQYRAAGVRLDADFTPADAYAPVDTAGVRPIPVRGETGWLDPAEHQLTLPLPGRVRLVLRVGEGAGDLMPGDDELARAAEALEVGPPPDISWARPV